MFFKYSLMLIPAPTNLALLAVDPSPCSSSELFKASSLESTASALIASYGVQAEEEDFKTHITYLSINVVWLHVFVKYFSPSHLHLIIKLFCPPLAIERLWLAVKLQSLLSVRFRILCMMGGTREDEYIYIYTCM